MELLICPVCGARLARVGKTFKCPRSHSFDVAREGYVNLLLGGRKRPRSLGDTREMLRARRRFLTRGFYDPLCDAINARVCAHLAGGRRDDVCIADVGCGEGHYLGQLKRHLDRRLGHSDVCYVGMDVSREAARLAAREHPGIHFFVANVNEKVLLSDDSVQVLLDVFAPRNAVEFDRVIAPDGLLLIVIPGPRHLANLRDELDILPLGIEADKRQHVVEQFAGTFPRIEEHAVACEMSLTGADLADLVQMTPNYWHSSSQTWENVEAVESVQTEADFTILEFRR
jgi:23S rRNA (guanine745-N1)-methyltransferase